MEDEESQTPEWPEGVCSCCGCAIGGGCPLDTEEERESYRAQHPEVEE